MRILGIDPGYAIVGVGVVDCVQGQFAPVRFGAIITPAGMPFEERLCRIYDEVTQVIAQTHPDEMSMEKLFFSHNQKTGIDVAQARGVLLLAGAQAGLPIREYTPLQIKLSLVGYGQAVKSQVQEMTRSILGLREVPQPDDTADALAVAICHGHAAGSLLYKL